MIKRENQNKETMNTIFSIIIIASLVLVFAAVYIIFLILLPSFLLSLVNEELIRYWVIFVISVTGLYAISQALKGN